ncbi:MAG: DNA-binding MarR family transcriptional regulator [Patiriisocius sp.]|jgi:DNA-binding MarR family transcriptional regulator
MKSVDKELVSNFSSEQHRLVVNIMYTADWISTKVSEAVKSKGVTNVQYNILRILLGSSPNCLSVGNVKKRLINKNADVTRLLDRLEQKKLISRTLCPENRRQVDVGITDSGIHLMKELSPLMESALDNYYDQVLLSDECKISNELLDRIRNH